MPGELPVRLCNYMDVYAGRYLVNSDRYMEATCTNRELAVFGLRRFDVLITKDSESPDDIAVPALIDDDVQELVCGYHLAVLRLRSDAIDPVVLLKQLESERLCRYFGQRAGGSTRYGLSTRAIAQAPILVPPQEIQHTIAAVHRSLDTQITHTEALIAKQEQVRAGLMQDLFTRGVDETGRLRPPREEAPELYHETALGWLPKEWNVSTLGSLVDRNRPIVYGILMPGEHKPDGVPVVKVRDMQKGVIETNGLLCTSRAIDLEYARSRLAENDILLSIRGTVGRLALVPNELQGANITQDTARISIRQGSVTYFRYYLEGPQATRFFLVNTLGNAVQGINLRDVRRLSLPVPSEPEQDAIASALETAVSIRERFQEQRDKLCRLRTALLRALLTPPVAAAAEPGIAAE